MNRLAPQRLDVSAVLDFLIFPAVPSSGVVRRTENPICLTRRHPVYFSVLLLDKVLWSSMVDPGLAARDRGTAARGFSDIGGHSTRFRVRCATFDFLKAVGSTLPSSSSLRTKKYTRVSVNITRADNNTVRSCYG